MEIQTLSMQPLGHCSWGILPSCPPQILELVIIPAHSPAKTIKIVFTSSWKLASTQFPMMDFLKRQWYWPALLLHVHPPLQQVLTARQRRRGRTWADGGLGTPGKSVQRSDAKNYTEPSAEPCHWAAAPGWNLTNERQKWANEHEEVQSNGACVCGWVLPDLDSLKTDTTCRRKFVSCPVLFEVWFFGEMSSWHHSGPYVLLKSASVWH